MRITWQDRLELEPELRDLSNWPFVDTSAFSPSRKRRYLMRARAISRVLSGDSLTQVALDLNISPGTLSKWLSKALSAEEHERPPLTAALIPGLHVQKGVRIAPLGTLDKPRGTRGALEALFYRCPRVKEKLDRQIEESFKRTAHSQNLTPKILHTEFLRLLREENWPLDTYPFSTLGCGKESIRRYLHKRRAELALGKVRNLPQRVHLTGGTRAYEHIQIDEQIVDTKTRIEVALADDLQDIRIARMCLLLAVDVATDCYVAYHLSLTQTPSQWDLLELLYRLHEPWQPMDIRTPGLKYVSGALFPSALGDPFTRVAPAVIHFDNAKAHMARTVQDYVCNVLGATKHLGRPASPKSRNWVEYAFKRANEVSHRFASTTGSHVKDPIRETRHNLKRPPIVTLRTFEEALSSSLATHNITPQARLGGYTPLALLRQQVDSLSLRKLPPDLPVKSPFIRSEEVKLHFKPAHSNRPFIYFQQFRYRASEAISETFLNKPIRIVYDARDIRTLEAYTVHGEPICKFYIPNSWNKKPLSIQTRRYIGRLARAERIRMDDPIGGYFDYLIENRKRERVAMELIRVYRECFPREEGLGDDGPYERVLTGPGNDVCNPTILPWSATFARRNDSE